METDQLLDKINIWIRSSIPFFVVLFFLLFGLSPTKVPGLVEILPIYSIIGAYYWSIYKPNLFSYGSGFVIGIIEDFLFGLPLGSSPLVILIIQWVIFNQQKLFTDDSFKNTWFAFCFICFASLLLKWVIISILSGTSFFSLVDLLFTYFLTLAFYPCAAWVFTRVRILVFT